MALFTRVAPIGRKARTTSYHIYEFSRVGVYSPWGYNTPSKFSFLGMSNSGLTAANIGFEINQPYCKYFEGVFMVFMHYNVNV